MADPTIAEIITTKAPHYATDSRIPTFTILAEEFVGDKVPMTLPHNYAVALQILHWLTMADRASAGNEGAVGSIMEEKEGELTIKYSSGGNVMAYTSDLKAELNQTTFGRELFAFYKRYIISAFTAQC